MKLRLRWKVCTVCSRTVFFKPFFADTPMGRRMEETVTSAAKHAPAYKRIKFVCNRCVVKVQDKDDL